MTIDLKGWGRLSGDQVVVSATLDLIDNPTLEATVDAAGGAGLTVAGVLIRDLTVKFLDGTLVGTDATETVSAVFAAIQPGEDERLVTINTPTVLDGSIRIYGWGVVGSPGEDDTGETPPTPGAAGVLTRYWQNIGWTGQPLVSQVEPIPYLPVPAVGDLPPGVETTPLSVRWTGNIVHPTTGAYRYRVIISDWGDLYIDNTLILTVSNENQGTRDSGTFQRTAAEELVFWASMVDQGNGDREFKFYWMLPGTTVWVQVPASAFKQAAVTTPPQPVIEQQAHAYVEYVNRYED